MCEVLQDMKSRKVNLDVRTFKEILFPRILKHENLKDSEIIKILEEEGGVAPSLTFNELLRFYLIQKDIGKAASLTSESGLRVYPNMMRALIYAVNNTEDYWSGAKIVEKIEGRGREFHHDHMGKYLIALCRRCVGNPRKMESIVRALQEAEVTITRDSRNRLVSMLNDNISSEMASMLRDLESRKPVKEDDENSRKKLVSVFHSFYNPNF